MENTKLSECIFEHIKDTFYYGLFGDFILIIDKNTGYFNATKLCSLGKKSFKHWNGPERTKKLFYEIELDNNDKFNEQITGTYVPKELILDIASWVSIEFYNRCNNIIINYFVKEFKNMDEKTLKYKIIEVEEFMEKLILKTDKVINVKGDKIDKLKETILKQEQYIRSLDISLKEVKDQNKKLLDAANKKLHKQNKKNQRVADIIGWCIRIIFNNWTGMSR